MTTGNVRRPLRATLAAICAVSLAASMALPLVAVAQTGDKAVEGESAALQVAEINEPTDATIETPAAPEQPAAPDAGEAADGAEAEPSTPGESAPGDADTEAPAETLGAAGESDGSDTVPSDDVQQEDSIGGGGSLDDAALPGDSETLEAPGQAEGEAAEVPVADEEPDGDPLGHVLMGFTLRLPAEYSSNENNGRYIMANIPVGMTFKEAKEDDIFLGGGSENDLFFFNLGTGAPVPIGAAYPGVNGYVFGGWMDESTGVVLTEDTPITESYTGKDFVSSWKKTGSNFSFVGTGFGDEGLGSVTAEGILAGANIPPGADLKVMQTPGSLSLDFITAIDPASLGILADFYSCDVDLFVNGKQVHDGFGSLVLSFSKPGGFADGVTVRVWHQHADGTITYQDVIAANGSATITVTDLSTFAFAQLGKTNGSGTLQPPAGSGNVQKPAQGGSTQPANDAKADQKNVKETAKSSNELAQTGDENGFMLGATMALLTCALCTGGLALLMGNRKRSGADQR